MPSPSAPARARRAALPALAAALLALAGCGENPLPTGLGTDNPTGGAPAVGALLRLNAYTDDPCDTVRTGFRGGRVVAVSNRAIVVADTANPAGGFTTAEYQGFAAAFDTLVYPVDVRHFGEPADVDRNGRVVIFFTSAVNALTPRNVDYVVGGFFWSRDLFPRTGGGEACPGSNDAELFYMLAPDPTGAVNGNVRSKAYVAGSSVAVLAHEFQHLISASRRLYVLNADNIDEELWLGEGLSHVAEELLFYRASALAPRRRLTISAASASSAALDALNEYNRQNLSRFSDYLAAPEVNSPYSPDDSLAMRGASWSFLRYAADRAVAAGTPSDSTFYFRLVNSPRLGLRNLQDALTATAGQQATIAEWFRDWSVANYADGVATGSAALDPRFTHPSWVYRDVLPRVSSNRGSYPLAVRNLADGQAQTISLAAGGSAYLRFTVPAGGRATVSVRGAAGAAPPVAVRTSLVATAGNATPVTTYAGGTASVTAEGVAGAAATYGLVLFNSDTVARRRNTVTVTATGLTAAVAERGPAQPGPTLARLAAAAAGPRVTDAPVHARLRALGARSLASRVASARAVYAARRAER